MSTVGPNQELLCPMPGCGADLYVVHHCAVLVYAVAEPWPGAGLSTGEPSDAVSRSWDVECADGHTVFTSVDHARAVNTADLDADLDETADYAEPFNLDVLLAQLAQIGGSR